MQQLTENIIVLSPGEEIPIEAAEYLKIYLAGSVDLGDTYDWQDKFISGLVALTDSNDGLIMLKNQKYLIINPRFTPTMPEQSLQNPEFITKTIWSSDMIQQADAVFCNFLKKSVSPIPMMEFGMLLESQKMVVRCPESYINYPTVKVLCEKYSVPLFPSKISTVANIIQGMYAYIPRFQELQKGILPE